MCQSKLDALASRLIIVYFKEHFNYICISEIYLFLSDCLWINGSLNLTGQIYDRFSCVYTLPLDKKQCPHQILISLPVANLFSYVSCWISSKSAHLSITFESLICLTPSRYIHLWESGFHQHQVLSARYSTGASIHLPGPLIMSLFFPSASHISNYDKSNTVSQKTTKKLLVHTSNRFPWCRTKQILK